MHRFRIDNDPLGASEFPGMLGLNAEKNSPKFTRLPPLRRNGYRNSARSE
jgi:hypothetical protein